MILMISIIYGFFVSIGAGMSLIRESDQKVGELLALDAAHRRRVRVGASSSPCSRASWR